MNAEMANILPIVLAVALAGSTYLSAATVDTGTCLDSPLHAKADAWERENHSGDGHGEGADTGFCHVVAPPNPTAVLGESESAMTVAVNWNEPREFTRENPEQYFPVDITPD